MWAGNDNAELVPEHGFEAIGEEQGLAARVALNLCRPGAARRADYVDITGRLHPCPLAPAIEPPRRLPNPWPKTLRAAGAHNVREDVVMDVAEVDRWFAGYLADFIALGRGEVGDVRRILVHYGVPLILSSDAGCQYLTDEAQVLAAAQQQVDGMRSTGYEHSDELAAETTVLNRSCSVHRGRFARLRADGTEISQLEATYLITDGPAARRISAIVVHSAP